MTPSNNPPTPFAPGRLLALALTAAFLLSACGGGGGSPSNQRDNEKCMAGYEGTPPNCKKIEDETPNGGTTTPPSSGTTNTTNNGGSSGGGGGGGGGGNTGTTDDTTTTNNDNGDDNANEDEESTSETTDPTALFGILWNHDEDDGTTPERPYAFRTTYAIPDRAEDDMTTMDVDESMVRPDYIASIRRDGEYAKLTVEDIQTMIEEIRQGQDHGDKYYDAADVEFRRVANQYGHTPGPEGSHLQAFIDADEAGIAVLIAAQGVSKGIADAALADLKAIEELIELAPTYRAKAMAAKDALEGEATNLETTAAGLTADADLLNTWLTTPEQDRGAIPTLTSEGKTCTDTDSCMKLQTDLTTEAGKIPTEVTALRADAATIQVYIDDIAAYIATLALILPGDHAADTPEGLALRSRLRALGGLTAELLENQKAAKIKEFLEGPFEIAVDSSSLILLGQGANHVAFADHVAVSEDVIAATLPPAGTMDAWAALGRPTFVIARTIDDSDSDDPNQAALTDLKGQLGDHRARALTGKPGSEFVLADATNDQANYDGTNAPGAFYQGTYKGIHGTLYVDQVYDSNTATDVATWFFTPTTSADPGPLRGKDPTRFRYRDTNDDGTFELVEYIDYGMWLSEPSANSLQLNLIADVVGPQGESDLGTDVDVTTAPSNDNSLAARATYSGTALGLSARATGTGDEARTASGHFDADVSLTATFGANPMLGGTIGRFRSADPDGQGTAHVNPDWSATLDPTALTQFDHDGRSITSDTGGRVTSADISGTGVTGEWSATGYGHGGERPAGFFGGFRAEFSDGAAAGVYHAE